MVVVGVLRVTTRRAGPLSLCCVGHGDVCVVAVFVPVGLRVMPCWVSLVWGAPHHADRTHTKKQKHYAPPLQVPQAIPLVFTMVQSCACALLLTRYPLVEADLGPPTQP